MPLQNRVMPWGEIVADPARGTLTGNRGIIHRLDQTLGRARWRHRAWISCRLDWKGVRRMPMSPGTWTELFFLDEAVAMAAGHRPCALCRREAYVRFREAWQAAGLPGARATEIDAALHMARTRKRWSAPCDDLPDGAIAGDEGDAVLVLDQTVRRFAPDGYGPPRPLPSSRVQVLTPEPMVAVLRAGYRPALHPSASEA